MKNVSISAGTIARTIALALALLNQILTVIGLNPLDVAEDDVYTLCSTIATVVTAIIAWWENNSFTKAAIKADKYLDEVKGKE